MKYNLAIDCGGTKAAAILYDEQYRPVRSCQVSSTRSTTMPQDFIRKNINELITRMELADLHLGVISGVADSQLVDAIAQVCTVDQFERNGEVEVGLAAAGLRDGYLAICGTGATLGCSYQGVRYGVGGFGPMVYDAGSGYWLAREAFGKAIEDFELRGPHTMLTELIAEKLGYPREKFREAVFSIYSIEGVPPLTSVTACAPLVSKAAKAGDAVAYDILVRAARILAEQTNSVRIIHNLPLDLPVSVSGGVWRGHPVVFEEYCRVLQEKGLTGPFVLPEFEPIVGAILYQYLKTHDNLSPEEKARFREMYKAYLFA